MMTSPSKNLIDSPEFADVKRMLTLRLRHSKASTRKLNAMLRHRAPDGRARFQTKYHGAVTGRPTGTGFQPLNMSKGFDDPVPPEQLIRDIGHRDPKWLDIMYGDAMDAVGRASRHHLRAEKGKRFIAGDFVSIEAVLLSCLAGEEWKIEAFRRGDPLYELMGCSIHNLGEEAICLAKRDKKLFKATYPAERFDGKTCLGADTWVLTLAGWKRIVDVRLTDKLWDGNSWVAHEGILYQGRKKVVEVAKVEMTLDHSIKIRNRWTEAREVVSKESILSLALETGLENLPFINLREGLWGVCSQSGLSVTAIATPIWLQKAISIKEKLQDAIGALKMQLLDGVKTSLAMLTFAQMTSIVEDYLTEYPLAKRGVALTDTKTTAREGSGYVLSGVRVKREGVDFFHIYSLLKGGISRSLRLIVSNLTEIMNRVILGLSQELKTWRIKDRSETYKKELTNLKPVYDLVNAGPNRCFTILSDRGPLIVHNCELAFGYQGALGAWLKFDDSGRHSDERIVEICRAWRKEHPAITQYWDDMGKAAIEAVLFPGDIIEVGQIAFEMQGDWLTMILPNGKRLWYRDPQVRKVMPHWHKPEEDEDCASGACSCRKVKQLTYMAQKEGRWRRESTYGGKLVENATQATSREVLVPALFRLRKENYPVILTVYDEAVAEVPYGHGSPEEMVEIMSESPGPWANGWPISVDAWEGERYKK